MNKRTLPSRPNLDLYKKLAKDLVKVWKSDQPTTILWEGNSGVVTRAFLAQLHPRLSLLSSLDDVKFVLADAQFIIALAYGFDSWPKFAAKVSELQSLDSPYREFVIAGSCPIAATHMDANLDEAAALLATHPGVASKDIFTACIVGDAGLVRSFLAKNPRLARRKGGPLGWDPLTYLCFSRFLRFDASRSSGFVEAARMLLEAGASVKSGWYDETHQPTPEFESLMYGAAGLARHAGVTQVLLDFGADPNDNETPYHSPEGYDNSAILTLLRSGRLTEHSKAMMLLRKADWHDFEGLKLMLEHGADPNFMLGYDSNALQHAIMRDNDLANIASMMDHGADPLLANSKGRTGLQLAARRGRKDLLLLFRERGVALELAGVDLLAMACALDEEINPSPEVVKELVSQGGALLSEFAGTGNAVGVGNLLDLGVPFGARYWGDGYFGIPPSSTALHVACWRLQPSVVKLLIERGADVNTLDGVGRTPLMWAVKACVDSYWMRRRTPESVSLLLKAGARTDGVKIPCGYDEVDALLVSATS